jgi:hypothetical protein
MERVCYLMLRASRASTGSGEAEVQGVVERLDTGEKRAFACGRELMAFVSAAVDSPSNFGATGGIEASDLPDSLDRLDPEAVGLRLDSPSKERRTP